MKRLTLVFLLLFLLCPPALAREQGQFLLETSASGVVTDTLNEVSINPAPSGEKLVLNVKNGESFELNRPALDPPIQNLFDGLQPAEQQKFLVNRAAFLSKAASVLTYTRLLFGFGSVIKQKIVQVFKRARGKQTQERPIEGIAEQMIQQEITTPIPSQRFSGLVRQRSHQIVQKLLAKIDKALWKQAPLIATQNEFAVALSLNVMAVAGFRGRGLGGSFGLGVSFGYNKEKKSFVFEFFHDTGLFEKAFTPVFMAGLLPRASVDVFSQKRGQEVNARKGYTFFTPGTPVSVANTENKASFGVIPTVLAFPPIVAEGMSYINRSSQSPLLRLSVSPFSSRFMQVQVGGLHGPQVVFQKITNFLKEIAFIKKRAAADCAALLETTPT